jgi:hypothetical protein
MDRVRARGAATVRDREPLGEVAQDGGGSCFVVNLPRAPLGRDNG